MRANESGHCRVPSLISRDTELCGRPAGGYIPGLIWINNPRTSLICGRHTRIKSDVKKTCQFYINRGSGSLET